MSFSYVLDFEYFNIFCKKYSPYISDSIHVAVILLQIFSIFLSFDVASGGFPL